VITGVPPLEVTATLAATEEYEITIEEARSVRVDQRFRGSYALIVNSSSRAISVLRPTSSVER